MNQPPPTPAHITVLERGWLSSNNILLHGATPSEGAVLVDTGYFCHREQTLALLSNALRPQETVRCIVNTHLHSDHCGGNRAISERYQCPILIPPGEFSAIERWDDSVLSYHATGQQCERFNPSGKLMPGQTLKQGRFEWQIHAAPGHDPHSVILFEPESGTLISADALWERGFGIIFPELDGTHAFLEVEATLDIIEGLRPKLVIPGHGAPFQDVQTALLSARERLRYFQRKPERHAFNAAKALTVFHMLETQKSSTEDLLAWLQRTPILASTWQRFFGTTPFVEWTLQLVQELVHSGALQQESTSISVRGR
ncbi:MBL fold metallo-hydrolase [Roseateles chitinivorans]|uniref:MBL fold metallo-hydrolase n=1 Tax=Roseateles chitinivorans TaxID=2917965 RepID=UPI003D669BFD